MQKRDRVLIDVDGAEPDNDVMTNSSAPLMTRKIKLHDGIVGGLIALSGALALWVDPRFIGLAALTGLVMVQSSFTGFCPVHYAIRKAGLGDA
jgi:hypothetical protein